MQVKPERYACPQHWWTLPRDIRERIWSTYHAGDEVRHVAAMQDAQAFFDGETALPPRGGLFSGTSNSPRSPQ